jgi:hypothetical protein
MLDANLLEHANQDTGDRLGHQRLLFLTSFHTLRYGLRGPQHANRN